MFSVNIDKLVNLTDQEEQSFQNAVSSINDSYNDQLKTLAIVGAGIDSFKLAYTFSEMNKKVLFIDADLDKNVFLGKYKLGKNLKGFANYIAKGTEADEDMICLTNHDNMNIVFTGDTKDTSCDMITEQNMKSLLDTFENKYDLIVVQSDDQGIVAKNCDTTVVMIDLDQYSEVSADIKVSELNNNGCYVLGVIINE